MSWTSYLRVLCDVDSSWVIPVERPRGMCCLVIGELLIDSLRLCNQPSSTGQSCDLPIMGWVRLRILARTMSFTLTSGSSTSSLHQSISIISHLLAPDVGMVKSCVMDAHPREVHQDDIPLRTYAQPHSVLCISVTKADSQRNPFPAAVQKDKHSRSGLVKSESLRKQGAGAHNWGSFKEDGAYRIQADDDAANEQEIFAMEERDDNVAPLTGRKQSHDPILDTSATNGDVEGNKGIAHSPSDSMSSIDSVNSNKGGQRRMSNVSDEERERARVYREGVMGRGRKSARVFVRNIADISCRPCRYCQDLLRDRSVSPQQFRIRNLPHRQGKLI